MTKEQLKGYKDMKKELADLRLRIDSIEASLYGPHSQHLDGLPRSGVGKNDFKEKQIDRKEKLKRLYEYKKEELDAALIAVEKAIEKLKPRERQIIRMRYIDGAKWEQICLELSYSWRQVHRIHSKALQKLEEE